MGAAVSRHRRYAQQSHLLDRLPRRAASVGSGRAAYARLRAAKSQPQLTEIKTLLTAAQPVYGEGTDQQAAIDFVLRQWPRFAAYAQQGDLPIDNNDAERALRMIVIGRKNWMLVGSEDAAPSAAALFTVMESCRLCGVEPRAYLSHVVKQLHAGASADVLTPRTLSTQFPLRE